MKARELKKINREDIVKQIFKQIKSKKTIDYTEYEPVAKAPLPKPLRIRLRDKWWVRCVNDKIISGEDCYGCFMSVNAAYQRKRACWRCPLGRVYRELSSEDTFSDTRVEWQK